MSKQKVAYKGLPDERPSELCKKLGLKSLVQVSRLSGVSEQTLINWHTNKPDLFLLLLKGCMAELAAIRYREAMGVDGA